ncbi:hypothetical protein DI458_35820 [Burkholderia contaminans]|nr:hypothetical protein [Burkholderia contaminans]MBA9841870.1 hypothetical protein [Burkholderia contaminans]MBA9863612.1 hypothetical protein [Burkholderia contaminans]MBA9905353.1 hypothetical protein [Burkholderia contaminans]MBA9929273.1 hypothetical protein [Burkholderia contaminans]
MVGATPSNSSKRAFYALARPLRRAFAGPHPSSPPARRKLSFDNHSHFDLESRVFHFVMFRVARAAGVPRNAPIVHLPLPESSCRIRAPACCRLPAPSPLPPPHSRRWPTRPRK